MADHLILTEDVRGQQVDTVAQREADEAELGREERDLLRGSGGPAVTWSAVRARSLPGVESRLSRRHVVCSTWEADEVCSAARGAIVGPSLSLSGGLPARVSGQGQGWGWVARLVLG